MTEIRTVFNAEGAICGGEKPLAECPTAQAMLSEPISDRLGLEGYEERLWTKLTYLSRTCMDCGRGCTLDIASIEGQLTGETRFTFTEPKPTEESGTAAITLKPRRIRNILEF